MVPYGSSSLHFSQLNGRFELDSPKLGTKKLFIEIRLNLLYIIFLFNSFSDIFFSKITRTTDPYYTLKSLELQNFLLKLKKYVFL